MANLRLSITNRLKGTALGTYLRKRRWNRQILSRNAAIHAVDKYMKDESAEEKEKVIADILDMAMKYRFSAEEYFCYHFRDRSEEERRTFISDLNRVDFCERLNKAKNLVIFNDKIRTYQVFQKYYLRDCCGVVGKKDIPKACAFVRRHDAFVFKPIDGSCGDGVSVIKPEPNEDAVDVISRLSQKSPRGYVLEELIQQVPETAQFHPSSVNTIRVATVRYPEGVEVIAAFFRTGRGGNFVDNAGAGGVFGVINIDNGEIVAVGDEYGNLYTVHPDTQISMAGFVIPQWEDAVELVKELATVVKGNRYAGWDLALTEKGWALVEANARGQFLWQMPLQKGFLAETNAILRRLGLREMTDLSAHPH